MKILSGSSDEDQKNKKNEWKYLGSNRIIKKLDDNDWELASFLTGPSSSRHADKTYNFKDNIAVTHLVAFQSDKYNSKNFTTFTQNINDIDSGEIEIAKKAILYAEVSKKPLLMTFKF